MVLKGKGRRKNTTNQKNQSFLRRVCIIDGTGKELLNEVVKVPPSVVKNSVYKTNLVRQISDHVLPRLTSTSDNLNVGISPHLARQSATEMVHGRIIVGHSLDHDLGYLGLKNKHPQHLLRDTARYPPFFDDKGNARKLSTLLKIRLGREIQPEGKFHCCLEDATSALDLYLSVWEDFEKGIDNPAGMSGEVTTAVDDGGAHGEASPPITPNAIVRQQNAKNEYSTRCQTASSLKALYRIFIMKMCLVVAFPYRLVGDVVRLLVETPGLLVKAVKRRLGYEPTPKSGVKRRKKAKRRLKKLKRVFVTAFTYVRSELVLLLQLSAEPLFVFKSIRNAGDVVGLRDHWSIAAWILAASLLLETTPADFWRNSLKYRLSCLALVYYHSILFRECNKDIDWEDTASVVRSL